MTKRDGKTPPLIKGYLPVRLTLSSNDGDDPKDTFFFLKEHFGSEKNSIFVANVPIIPGIQTRKILGSLLGRYGQVERVTLIEPRNKSNTKNDESTKQSFMWTRQIPSFLSSSVLRTDEGKFAYVVFSSTKEMRKCLRGLQNVMVGSNPGLTMDRLEIQTLADATFEHQGKTDGPSDTTSAIQPMTELKGILAVSDRYRRSIRALSRKAMMDACNRVIETYDESVEQDIQARKMLSSQEDEDGFITLSYSTHKVGSKRDLEGGSTTTNNRRGSKRRRKKKEAIGSSQLQDFYRFQLKETRKKSVQELRKKFEEDLAKIQKLKEEKHYQPF